MTARLTSLIICVLLLTSCGYHLSGKGPNQGKLFAPELKRISVEGLGHYEPFRRDLVSALRSYGFKVVKPDAASARFVVVDRHQRNVAAVVGDNAKVREYLLLMKVRFTVTLIGKAKTRRKTQSVQIEVPYQSNPDELLVNQKLLAAARRRGEELLILNIIDRLASF